jgi:hypothetical protein
MSPERSGGGGTPSSTGLGRRRDVILAFALRRGEGGEAHLGRRRGRRCRRNGKCLVRRGLRWRINMSARECRENLLNSRWCLHDSLVKRHMHSLDATLRKEDKVLSLMTKCEIMR